MNATTEKTKPTEARRAGTLPRPKRPGPGDAETVVTGNETLWQQFQWRELNLESTASTLRHWHD